MKQNTFSLLNSAWMIEDSGASSLIPQLISLIKGNQIEKVQADFPVIYMEMDSDGESYDVPEMNTAAQYICVLGIKTPIFKYDQRCGPIGTRSMTRILKEWEGNDNVIGVVIDIDSPGGQVSGLAEFANFIYNYSKPIVSFTDGYQCSAADYIASACNFKFASEYADLIGSNGTMLKYVNMDGILTKEGAVIKDIYASKSTRKNEEFRALEETGSDALILKNILDPMCDNFHADVRKFRPQTNAEVFDGAVYTPVNALDMNIIDDIGTIQNAFEKVIELSKENKQPSNNQNTNTMSKQLPRVQAVLGLDAPLASTEENGSYLNTEQLSTVEAHIETLEGSNTIAAQQLTDANTAHETAIALVTENLKTATNAVDNFLVTAGIPVQGTLKEKISVINAHLLAQGLKDGATGTRVITDVSGSIKNHDFVDASASHNQMANQLFK